MSVDNFLETVDVPLDPQKAQALAEGSTATQGWVSPFRHRFWQDPHMSRFRWDPENEMPPEIDAGR